MKCKNWIISHRLQVSALIFFITKDSGELLLSGVYASLTS